MQSIYGDLNLLKRRMQKLIEKIRLSCKNFKTSKEISSNSLIYLHSMHTFRVINKRMHKNEIGFIRIKGQTYKGCTCNQILFTFNDKHIEIEIEIHFNKRIYFTLTGLGFKRDNEYYEAMDKIYGKNRQSGHERDLTLIGLWRHIRGKFSKLNI